MLPSWPPVQAPKPALHTSRAWRRILALQQARNRAWDYISPRGKWMANSSSLLPSVRPDRMHGEIVLIAAVNHVPTTTFLISCVTSLPPLSAPFHSCKTSTESLHARPLSHGLGVSSSVTKESSGSVHARSVRQWSGCGSGVQGALGTCWWWPPSCTVRSWPCPSARVYPTTSADDRTHICRLIRNFFLAPGPRSWSNAFRHSSHSLMDFQT